MRIFGKLRHRLAATILSLGLLSPMATALPGCREAPPEPAPNLKVIEADPRQVGVPSELSATGMSASVMAAPAGDGAAFQFRDATREWNLEFQRDDGARGQNLIQESTGGGVGLFDYDLDGRLDVFLTQGCSLPRSQAPRERSNEMFRNVGTFQKVTRQTGLTSYGFHTGCAVGDLDEDGFPDLYVTAYGRSSLWHNNGDGTFREGRSAADASIDIWSSSAALADFNADGLLDLFVAGYLQAPDDPPRICRFEGSPTGTKQCPPTLFAGADDYLFINDGQGGFVDVTKDAGITGRNGKGLGVVASDFNGDGLLDVFVANDGTPCFLYRQTGSAPKAPGTDDSADGASRLKTPLFEECAAELGVAQNGEGKATAAMGIAHGDYDRDGWTDLYVTNFYLEPNTLFRNFEGRGFLDQTAAARLGPVSRKTLGFGTEFLDVDHDGWLDLVAANGHIEDRTWAGQEPYQMRPHLFRNDRNKRFTDVASSAGAYFNSEWVGRGLAVGDVDRDGDLDLVISHQVAPSVLVLNETLQSPAATSVVIRLAGRDGVPRSGIGTIVTATDVTPIQKRQLAGGGSFQSASALEFHLGLAGKSEFQELEFRWSDGHIDRWAGVRPGQYVAVKNRGIYRLDEAIAD